MQTREAIQRVQSLYSKGVQSDDSRLTPRHIYSALLTARAILLRQQVNKNQATSKWLLQPLPCAELITAPIHECPCVPINCKILRTKEKLPKPITGLEGSLITYVTSLDGNIRFDPDSFENVRYSVGNKYTKNKPTYYISNGYLYITVLKNLKAITIVGLFDDFIEASLFPSICGTCEECECNDILDIEFPIDKDMERPLFQLANDELIIMFKQMKEDRQNNTTDDAGTVGGMVHQNQQPEQ